MPLHRPDADLKQLRGLVLRESEVVARDDDLPLPRGQGLDGGGDSCRLVEPHRDVLEVAIGGNNGQALRQSAGPDEPPLPGPAASHDRTRK